MRNKTWPGFGNTRIPVLGIIAVMIFTMIFPAVSGPAYAFSGKKGDSYNVTEGGRIDYAGREYIRNRLSYFDTGYAEKAWQYQNQRDITNSCS